MATSRPRHARHCRRAAFTGREARSACRAYRLVATLLLLSLLVSAHAADAPVRRKIALRDARIITVSGADIEKGTIVIEDGRITQVGAEVKPPWDAEVIDASGKVVMPGFVEAQTAEGTGWSSSYQPPNERVLDVPFVSMKDAIDPISWFMEDSLRDGVTTMLVLPGDDTLLGGTGVVVKPVGKSVQEILVRDYSGLKLSLQPRADSSRMAHLARLRKYFADLADYTAQYNQRKADAAEAKEPFTEELDPRRQPVLDLLAGKLQAFCYCPTASDVVKAFALSKELKFAITPILGPDCWRAAEFLGKQGVPVLLDADLVAWDTNEETETEEMIFVPRVMAEAGVKFALQRSPTQIEGRYFWMQAARCVAGGLSRAEALKAVTLYPAQMIGLGDRLGSIEAGKEANLLLLTGDPLEAQTWVDQVLIGGQVVYKRSEDPRLKRLLQERKPEKPAEPKPAEPGAKPPAGAAAPAGQKTGAGQ